MQQYIYLFGNTDYYYQRLFIALPLSKVGSDISVGNLHRWSIYKDCANCIIGLLVICFAKQLPGQHKTSYKVYYMTTVSSTAIISFSFPLFISNIGFPNLWILLALQFPASPMCGIIQIYTFCCLLVGFYCFLSCSFVGTTSHSRLGQCDSYFIKRGMMMMIL